jgi:hypothetical protein
MTNAALLRAALLAHFTGPHKMIYRLAIMKCDSRGIWEKLVQVQILRDDSNKQTNKKNYIHEYNNS